jgi:hypothetical protein
MFRSRRKAEEVNMSLLLMGVIRILSSRVDLLLSNLEEVKGLSSPLSSTIELSRDLYLAKNRIRELEITMDMLLEALNAKVERDGEGNYLLVEKT